MRLRVSEGESEGFFKNMSVLISADFSLMNFSSLDQSTRIDYRGKAGEHVGMCILLIKTLL